MDKTNTSEANYDSLADAAQTISPRLWLAGMAMHALIREQAQEQWSAAWDYETIALQSFALADAMLEANE